MADLLIVEMGTQNQEEVVLKVTSTDERGKHSKPSIGETLEDAIKSAKAGGWTFSGAHGGTEKDLNTKVLYYTAD